MPIHCVVYYNYNHLLDVLLKDSSGVELNSRDVWGNTALIYTVSNNNFESTKKLIEKKPILNVHTSNNETALSISIINDHEKIFDLLLDNNAAAVNIDKSGNNILHSMISYEHNKTLYEIDEKYYQKIIDKHPEFLFIKNKEGKTPLDLLAKWNIDNDKKILINSIVKKVDKYKFKNNEGMSL